MTKLIFKLSLLLLVLITTNLQAQDEVKIKNASGTTLMEVREEGVIITKLTTSERTANATTLTSAESGLMVYDTDTQSFWVWKNTEWIEIGGTDLIDDADADPTNEIQALSKAGNTVSLSNNGGSFTDEVDDADADPTNEIQEKANTGEGESH